MTPPRGVRQAPETPAPAEGAAERSEPAVTEHPEEVTRTRWRAIDIGGGVTVMVPELETDETSATRPADDQASRHDVPRVLGHRRRVRTAPRSSRSKRT